MKVFIVTLFKHFLLLSMLKAVVLLNIFVETLMHYYSKVYWLIDWLSNTSINKVELNKVTINTFTMLQII